MIYIKFNNILCLNLNYSLIILIVVDKTILRSKYIYIYKLIFNIILIILH